MSDQLKWFGDPLSGFLFSPDMEEEIQKLQDWYLPADSIDEATDFLSTEEILQAIKQLNPSSKIKLEDIFNILRDAGYSYAPDPGKMAFQLKWLLIRKF